MPLIIEKQLLSTAAAAAEAAAATTQEGKSINFAMSRDKTCVQAGTLNR